MKNIDLIIENIEYAKLVTEQTHKDELLDEALAAARELKTLKPVLWKATGDAWFYEKPLFEATPLYALEAELDKPEADLFWEAGDPESGYDSIEELISNYMVGDELKILRAKVLEPIKIKITQACDEEFEYVEVTK